MKNYLIAERYAEGLAKVIDDNEILMAVNTALQGIRRVYLDHHDLRSALNNHAIDTDKRSAVVHALVARAEAPDVIARFLDLLLRRGRIEILPDIASIFSRLVDTRLQRVGARVTTAHELSPEEQQRINGTLEKYFDKSVQTDWQVDPEILGGMIAQVGGTVIDGSLRSRLRQLKLQLLTEGI